ncbi:MAG: phosphopentomutase [Candidatus Izimaplasma sp.]|nr:phosphopentomutase [Candidatus Izimaplasma bacterium]
MFKRVFLIVIDSVGFGEAEDAAKFGDEGSNTIGHISEVTGGISLPNMQLLGAGNLTDIKGVPPVKDALGYYTKMKEISNGKDTMTGHWELMGLKIEKPFITFTENGFPDELIEQLEEKTGRKIIGNKAESGTTIIKELGERQLETGELIVYTSADSVLQIAAHEEAIGLDNLYEACEIARELTQKDEWKVGRVIARPFIGDNKDNFERTANRHDYALKPFEDTTLTDLKEAEYDVIGFGKINDIFDGEGITEYYRQGSNKEGMENYIEYTNKDFTGLAFLNLVDFDAKYGHRRNPEGYKDALIEFDEQLGTLMKKINDDDLLIITADHGNDPTFKGTDHTREDVPLLIFNPTLQGGKLPIRETFADIAATISDNFEVTFPDHGTSFLNNIMLKK